MTEIGLKPCPFCGSEAEIYTGSYYPFSLRSYDYVYCKGCGVTTRMYDTEREAAEAWNKYNTVKYEPTSYSCRACKNATDEEIKRLKEENARLQKEVNEAIELNYKNAFDIQQQAERGEKYAQKENSRLREALEFYEAYDNDDGITKQPLGCEAREPLKGGNEPLKKAFTMENFKKLLFFVNGCAMEGFRVGKKDSDVFLYYEIMKDVSDDVFDYTKFDEETSKFIWGKK